MAAQMRLLMDCALAGEERVFGIEALAVDPLFVRLAAPRWPIQRGAAVHTTATTRSSVQMCRAPRDIHCVVATKIIACGLEKRRDRDGSRGGP
ncbi:hypothetical protein WME76_27065 [Sorangium sp. So ce119]